jgi:hypothetical protein
MYYDMLVAFRWLNSALYFAGLVITGWGFWKSRKRGYLILAAYFLLVCFSLAFGRTVTRAIWKMQNNASGQAMIDYRQDCQQLEKKYFPSGLAAGPALEFPLGAIVLVAGLWVLTKHESRKSDEPIGSTERYPAGDRG